MLPGETGVGISEVRSVKSYLEMEAFRLHQVITSYWSHKEMLLVSHNLEPSAGDMHIPALSPEREKVLLLKLKASRRIQELSVNTCLSLDAFLM